MLQLAVRETSTSLIIFLAVIAIGLAAALYMYFIVDKYSLLYFGDAASHSLGARKIVDWMEPGLHQIGTVWLPLPHLLLLPFTLIDPLFVTGFAGVAVSLPCFAITSVLIYKMVRRHTSAALTFLPVCAAMLYVTNPSILYMGITAMTEAPFMLFFVGSAYYFQKWLENSDCSWRYMGYSAIFVSLASLCRYEAWILPIFLIPAAIIITARSKQMDNKSKAYAVIFSLISISGILFWLGYNELRYGDALEFASAEYYSAASQAADRPVRETLFLKPANVLSVYVTTALMMYGPVLLATAAAGFAVHAKARRKTRSSMTSGENTRDNTETTGLLATKSRLLYVFLALPPIFTLVTLLVGIGEMTFWFNSRFLILMAPLVILLTSVSVEWIWRRYGSTYSGNDRGKTIGPKSSQIPSLVVVSLFLFQLSIPAFGGVVTYLDAKGGFEYRVNPYAVQTGEALRSLYDGEGTIMVLTGSAQQHRIMLTSGIALRQFDEIIESSTWKKSYQEPWAFDRWVIIGKSPDSDGVMTTKYWAEERRAELDSHYTKVYENAFYEILVLK